MRISIIAAHDLGKVIGLNGTIPWYVKDDLKRFKSITAGKTVIMGRKTFDSIGKPLPNRINIVITSDVSGFKRRTYDKFKGAYSLGNLVAVSSNEEALQVCKSYNKGHVFIIGGSEIYRNALSIADDMYITVVFEHYEGDTYFPHYTSKTWEIKSVEYFDGDENAETPDYAFYYLERRRPGVFSRAIKFLNSKLPWGS